MNSNVYLNKLKESLTRYFDIELDKEVGERKFALYGRYYTKNSKYFALKNVEVYSFKINEYVLYNNCNKLNIDYINLLKEYIIDNVDNIVIRDSETMSSGITLLISSEEDFDDEIIKEVKKFKFYKSYSLGFKGWVNVKLILINLKTYQVYSNSLGRREKKRFIFLE